MLKNFQGCFQIRQGKLVYIQHPVFRSVASRKLSFARKKWKIPDNYFHFHKGGHVAALKKHENSEYFARLDIKDFFSSVSKNKILKSLINIGFSFADAREMASESVVNIDGKLVLPYGFIQSPFLASLTLSQSGLGKCLKRLESPDLKISIYMDDILLSSVWSPCVESAMSAITDAGKSSLFHMNSEKCVGPALQVEIFNIELSKNQLRINKSKLEEFQQRVVELGDCISSRATIAYVKTINKNQADQLITILEQKYRSGDSAR